MYESKRIPSVKSHDPIGILSLCRLAEPTAHTHAGEAGFHNVGVVGRAALPAGANGTCRTQRTGGADLAAGGHAAVVKGRTCHKTLASGVRCGAQTVVHGQRCQSTGSAHSIDVFLHRPISGIGTVNAPAPEPEAPAPEPSNPEPDPLPPGSNRPDGSDMITGGGTTEGNAGDGEIIE